MTPQEKAQQLVDRYFAACNCTIAGTHTIFKELAKDLAIIHVQELIDCTHPAELVRDAIRTGNINKYCEEYWQKVKECLETEF